MLHRRTRTRPDNPIRLPRTARQIVEMDPVNTHLAFGSQVLNNAADVYTGYKQLVTSSCSSVFLKGGRPSCKGGLWIPALTKS